MSGVGEVVCEGWLRKSPPEKKLRRHAWKRRWFVLRSGRLSGEPDVLQYYKNQQSRRPIRTINLNLCEQVDAGLSFTKKELESSFVFDLRTEERTWYLVAESEENMNRWVSSICLLCGFNPTEDVPDRPPLSVPSSVPVTSGSTAVSMPPPYDPVSVQQQDSDPNAEDDYLWLSNCQSHIRPPQGSSTSLETDYSDLYPAPSVTSSSSSCSSSPSPQAPYSSSGCRTALWTVTGLSQSLDSASDPHKPGTPRSSKARCHPSPHPRKHSLDFHLRPVAINLPEDPHCYTPPSGYQIPRVSRRPSSTPSVDSVTQSELQALVPPPRPPKPPAIAAQIESTMGGMRPATLPRSGSQPQGKYGEAGGLPRSNTMSFPGRTQPGSDPSVTPHSLSDRASIFEFSESFNTYFFNKGMVPLGSVCSEDDEADENYVPMSAATTEPPIAPSSTSLRAHPLPPCVTSNPYVTPDPCLSSHEANYVSMIPLPSGHPPPISTAPCDLSSLGRQVPPPAHMGFRSSPMSPPPRGAPIIPDNEPPPIHRNLKPRKGASVPPTAEKPNKKPTQKSKVKPTPLDMTSLQQDWQEVPPPIRSPVTRTFTRDLPSQRAVLPSSSHSSSPSSDSDPDDSYVAMTKSNLSFSAGESSLRLMLHRVSEGGVSSSPLLRRAKVKQVEYLDLDLHTGRTPPTRQKRSTAEGEAVGDEQVGSGEERARGERARVDYVVVDPKRTKALRNTREAWHDGRMSTDKEK